MHRRAQVLLFVAAIAGVRAAAQSPSPVRDVAYTMPATADQRMDLYMPSGRDWPTVLFIHGGSLQESGERRASAMYADVCPALVAQGIGCATMDYRLAPASQWPAMPRDVASAVRWLHDSLAARGGSPERIVLVGHSSGCLLATVIGTDPSYLAAVGLRTTDVAGIAAMGCTLVLADTAGQGLSPERARAAFASDASDVATFGTMDRLLAINQTRRVGSHVPPTLVVIAESERFAPPILEQGARFVRLMHEAGRPADLRILEGRRHVTTTTRMREPGDPVTALLAAFAREPEKLRTSN